MKSSIIARSLAIGCIIGMTATLPLIAQTTNPPDNSSSSGQNGQPADNSAVNNHAQGPANNQSHTGGDDAQRRTGQSGDANSQSDSGSQ